MQLIQSFGFMPLCTWYVRGCSALQSMHDILLKYFLNGCYYKYKYMHSYIVWCVSMEFCVLQLPHAHAPAGIVLIAHTGAHINYRICGWVSH